MEENWLVGRKKIKMPVLFGGVGRWGWRDGMMAREMEVIMGSRFGGRPWYKRCGYHTIRVIVKALFVVCCRFRVANSDCIPRQGGVLLCPNHTSHLDPLIGGITTTRPMNFLAKKELFSVPFLRSLIRYLDAIPIDRFGMSAGAIKEMLKRLKRDEMILMFPEGTRSYDGMMGRVKPGFATLARKTKVPVVPIGIEGAYRVWPRTRAYPLPGPRICVVVGEPITPEQYANLSDSEFAQLLEMRIKGCIREARKLMKWPESELDRGLELSRDPVADGPAAQVREDSGQGK